MFRAMLMVAMAVALLILAPVAVADVDAKTAAAAKAIVERSGIQGGLVVHLGCGDGELTAALRLSDRYVVHGLDANAANVDAARKFIIGEGLYGKVSVAAFDGAKLPYIDNLVTLLVADDLGGVPQSEVLRVLAPGGVAMIGGQRLVAPTTERIDEWTHYLHGPDGNAVAADEVVDEPRAIQWVAEPRWGRSHEELASMSVAVSAGGRVFYIVDEAPHASIRYLGDWKLVARDAFNGVLLWKKDIPQWTDHLRHFRSGPAHLPRRLVAVGDRVFVTLGLDAPVIAIDAATGDIVRTYDGTESTEEILVEDGVLYLAVGTSEADRRGGGLARRGEPDPTDFRYLTAIDIDTGKTLWRKDFEEGETLLPSTLAVHDGGVYYQSTKGVGCVDATSGKQSWLTPRLTLGKRMGFSVPTLVATDDVILCADRAVESGNRGGKNDGSLSPSTGAIEWGVHGWNEGGFSRGGGSTVIAYDAKDGRELWSASCKEGYNAPVDIFVVGDTAWIGYNFQGFDLMTGEVKQTLKWVGPGVGMPHHRCYRNKASERLIFTGRSGIEVVSLEDGWKSNNSWIRGTCQFGILPANGLLYAPPDACACYGKVKVQGFFAAAPQQTEDQFILPDDDLPLEKGPAYGAIDPAKLTDGDWPMYRADVTRSGSTKTDVSTTLAKKWSTEIGGRLTQPVIVGDQVFVTATNTHTVYALSEKDGSTLWSFTAGGRIDSTPTFHNGAVLFGAADGWVYCVRATDGELAWRRRLAPRERLVSAFEQIESAWPVHGSVLVQNGTLYASAGRSSYLDGGIVLYRMNPETGEILSRTVNYDLDPKTGQQLAGEGAFDMEGVKSDILCGDGDFVFLKHFAFDDQGNRSQEERPHLQSITGLLGEEWFVRSYWVMGTTTHSGWGNWAAAANVAPFGRIMTFDGERLYSYGRAQVASGATGHKADHYQLAAQEQVMMSTARGAKKVPREQYWADDQTMTVRAMVLAGDRLVIAGPPDVGRKTSDILAYENEPAALAAFEGEAGVNLEIRDTTDGNKLAEYPLSAMPVFDGLSAADGKLFVSLKNGTVQCWGP